MLNRIAMFTAVCGLALFAWGCDKKDGPAEPAAGGDQPAATAPAAAVETAALDLTAALKEAGRVAETAVVIDAPKGATVKEEFGSVIVTAGDTFALSIGTDAADIAETRKFLETNDMQKFQRWVVESPDAVAAEAEFMRKKSVFMTSNVKVGEETLSCESQRGAKSFDEAAVQVMLTACKSLRVM